MAFGDFIKSGEHSSNSWIYSYTPDMGSNPTSGNLLILGASCSITGNTLSTPPSGFTELHLSNAGSAASWTWYYKISDGTEQSVNIVWNLSRGGRAVLLEYEWDGSVPTVTKNEDVTNISTIVNSQATGAATPSSTTNILIAMHANDAFESSSETGQAVDGSWIEDTTFGTTNTPGVKFSRLVNAAASAHEATHSDTDIGDEMYGAIAAFAVVSAASTAVTNGTGITSTSGAGTIDFPDVSAYAIDTIGCPFTTASHTIEYVLSDGTDTEVLAGTYNPKSGWAVVEVASAVKTTGSIFENFVGTITDASQVYYPTANTTAVSATGIVTTDATADIDMQFWDISDENWKQLTLLITPASTSSGNVRAMTRTMVSTMIRPMVK